MSITSLVPIETIVEAVKYLVSEGNTVKEEVVTMSTHTEVSVCVLRDDGSVLGTFAQDTSIGEEYRMYPNLMTFIQNMVNLHKQQKNRKIRPNQYSDIYPLTIVVDRYTGFFSGGMYLAFKLLPNEIPTGIFEDDVTCETAWEVIRTNGLMVGRGNTPDEAWKDLYHQIIKQ